MHFIYTSLESWWSTSHNTVENFWLALTAEEIWAKVSPIWLFVKGWVIFTAWHSNASTALWVVIVSIHLCVRPSVCHSVLCDKSKELAADILIPHERGITRVFWHQEGLAGDILFNLKFVLKLTYPLWKLPTLTDFHLYRLNHKC